MADADPFDPGRWQAAETPSAAPKRGRGRRSLPHRPQGAFLKGPVPWAWLTRAMALPGRALAVGLLLWRQHGLTGRREVRLCLARVADEGVPAAAARRGVKALEGAGLVAVRRRPGRGLEVTLLEAPQEQSPSG